MKIGQFRLTCEPWHYAEKHGGEAIILRFTLTRNGIEYQREIPFTDHELSPLDHVFDCAKHELIRAIKEAEDGSRIPNDRRY